jgi:hypothetical protein
VSAFVAGAPSPARAEGGPPALEQFQKKLKGYVELHRDAAKGLARLTKKGADAATVAAREKALAVAIRERRPQARPGDLFEPALRPHIAAVIARELAAPGGDEMRREIQDGNPRSETPQAPVEVAVNAAYPAAATLSTVPAPLLRQLPALPPELDYRFVGRDLVLRDTAANLIVDYMEDVLP